MSNYELAFCVFSCVICYVVVILHGLQKQLDEHSKHKTNHDIDISVLKGRIDGASRLISDHKGTESMFAMVDLTGKIVNAGGDTIGLIGVPAAELIGEPVTIFIEDACLINRHKKIFEEIQSSERQIRTTAITGMLKRQDGRDPTEVVVRLSKGAFRGNPIVIGHIFEIPV